MMMMMTSSSSSWARSRTSPTPTLLLIPPFSMCTALGAAFQSRHACREVQFARFEVLTAVLLKFQALWDVTLCRLVNSCRRFGGSSAFIIRVKQSKRMKALRSIETSVTQQLIRRDMAEDLNLRDSFLFRWFGRIIFVISYPFAT